VVGIRVALTPEIEQVISQVEGGESLDMKKILALVVAVLFTLAVAGLSFAADAKKDEAPAKVEDKKDAKKDEKKDKKDAKKAEKKDKKDAKAEKKDAKKDAKAEKKDEKKADEKKADAKKEDKPKKKKAAEGC